MQSLFDNLFADPTRDAQDSAVVILIVDDDPDCRMLIRDTIANCNVSCDVVELTNGREAMDYLHQRPPFEQAIRPALIYLDIEMPGMDGQATLAKIKTNPRLRDIPVVMMTGLSDEQEIRRAMRNGANSYTLKPANAEQFLRTISTSADYWLHVHQYPQRQGWAQPAKEGI